MRLHNNHPSRISQRVFDPSTPSTSTSRQEGQPVRPALKDGFENTVSSRRAVPSRGADVQSMFQEQFGTLSADKQRFHETLRGIFGEGYDTARAEQYRQQALSGDFGWMPPVEWVDASVLQGGQGAYDAQSGTVLLNRDLQADPELAASTYVEEAGHHLDAQLNTVDSQGDEGELFRRILGGEKLSGAQIAEMRAENDKGTIQLHGRDVEVEFRRGLFRRLTDAVGDGLRGVGNALGNVVDTVVDTIEDVKDAVGDAGQAVVGFVKNVAGAFGLGPQPDIKFDGKLVGAGNQVFEPGTPLDQIPGVTPSYNSNPERTVLYVNGIATDLEEQGFEMRHIAESTGMRVIGIHNATEGAVVDVGQSTADKLSTVRDLAGELLGKDLKGSNPAVDTLADTMYGELMAGREVHVMGYSQGGLITACALRALANRLRIENGLPQDQVEQLMSRINVETFGGAGAMFPDGPNYVHYVNTRDIVPMAFGLGLAQPLSHPGRDAVVHTFREGGILKFGVAHDLDDTYLMHRVPFEDARRGQF